VDARSRAEPQAALSWTLGPGEFLALGDARDDSEDCRAWGPIEEEEIVGRAALRLWPPLKFGGAR